MTKKGSTIGGALLVAGTAIGAGMLGLPIATAAGGFVPAVIIYLVCWLFSICTGLLMYEALLWLPKDVNIVTMSKKLLGNWGRLLAWFLYLFLFYSLSIAYVTAGGGVVTALLGDVIPTSLGMLIFTAIFGVFVYLGVRAVDRLNTVMMAGLIVSYFAFIVVGVSGVDLKRLAVWDFSKALLALPIIFTSFSYQGLLPSLVHYLHRDSKAVRTAIIVGTSLPFVVYIIWDVLIKGIVPLDVLIHARAQGLTAVQPLRQVLGLSMVYGLGQALAFFCVVTSFLGVTLGLFDFLADGFKLQKKGISRVGLTALVFGPPLLIAATNPHLFFTALNYGGGFGCVLLLGLLPILMVWRGRYALKLEGGSHQLFGGKPMLVLLLLFVIFEVIITTI